MASLRFLPPALSLLLTTALLGGCSGGDGPRPRLGTVSRGAVAEVVEAPATLAARANTVLRSPADGTITELKVRDGDRVEKGQVLARISSPNAEEQLDQARDADRQAARGTSLPSGLNLGSLPASSDRIARRGFQQARKIARKIEDPQDRAKVLAEIAKAEGDYTTAAGAARLAVTRLNTGLGSLTSALSALGASSRVQTRAAVKAAERTVDGLVLKAPFSGVVSLGGPAGGNGSSAALSSLVPSSLSGLTGGLTLPGAAGDPSSIAEGVPIASGTAVVTITDVSELRLTADIDESDILKVRRGGEAKIDFDALPEAVYDAEVYSIGVTPGEDTGGGVTYKVQLTLGEGTLADGSKAPRPKPGMSAIVRLTVSRVQNVLVIPTSAIVSSGRNSTVWVAENGRAVRRTVTLGTEGDAVIEVRSGLKEGDRIVVGSADSVRAGQELG